jgi:hypothetical protein
MQSVKRLDCGVEVVKMTTPEFYACMNYALVNGRTYPMAILGLDTDQVDEHAVSGYNSLIADGAFRIDTDGYPELMDAIPTISSLVISLDEMTYLTTVKATVSKSRMQFYWLHGEHTWSLMWKTKTDWYVCSASSEYRPSTVFMELVKVVMKNLGHTSIGFHFVWWTMNGNQLMSTIMRSKHDTIFIERRPENPILSSMIDRWPNRMSVSQFAERAGALLEVM